MTYNDLTHSLSFFLISVRRKTVNDQFVSVTAAMNVLLCMQIDGQQADYYALLRKAHAELGWKLLRSFPVDQLETSMQERFMDTFRAYIPLHTGEVLFPVYGSSSVVQ